MNNEFYERYNKLYMNKGNTVSSFNYSDLLEQYNNHLVLAVDQLSNSKEANIQYISDIVFGFDFFNSIVCSKREVSVVEINKYIMDRYQELESKNISSFGDYTLADKIFLKSCICLQEFERLGIKQCFAPLVCQIFTNSYILENLISKGKTKRMN